MKYLIICLIKTYQLLPFSSHNYCRHIPKCSDYGIIAIERFGALKGSYLTIKRIMRCNPFNKNTIDLVEERKEK